MNGLRLSFSWPWPWAWPWPLPALSAWVLAWVLFTWLAAQGLAAWGMLLGLGVSAALAMAVAGRWRRLWVLLGFPLSSWALGSAAALPPWAWALAVLPLMLLYPMRAWRDAPFFPTPRGALTGLADTTGHCHHLLEAGCGAGHGLRELREVFPQARISGWEWSWPLVLASRWATRAHEGSGVVRADIWARPWQGFDLVYLFQRPETMPRAWAKACADLPGGWLVSLEFGVPGVQPHRQLPGAQGRAVWVYRVPGTPGHSTPPHRGR